MATERRCPICGGAGGADVWDSADASAVRCDRCGAVYLARLTDRARAVARATYETIYARPAVLGDLTRRSYETVLDRFEPLRRTGRIVDVGCGAGGFLAIAARRGWEAIGTEAAPRAGALAAAEGARVLTGDAASREIPDSSVDVVTLWEVIEHVDDPLEVLAECRRLLRPGGFLYLTTPSHSSLQRRILRRRWPRYHLEHLTYFDPRTIAQAIDRAGLRPLRIRTKNFDPFLVAATLIGRTNETCADAPCAAGAPAQPGWAEGGREALRSFIKGGRAGRAIASSVNGLLARFALGDTLVAEAERG